MPSLKITPELIRNRRIIGLTFPSDNHLRVGLEPSVLHVLPPGQNVEFHLKNNAPEDPSVGLWLCSVYIAGMKEFKAWAADKDPSKIVVGGYHPTMFPESFLKDAAKIVVGPCNDIWATLAQENVFWRMSRFDQERVLPFPFEESSLAPLFDPSDSQKIFEGGDVVYDNSRFVPGNFAGGIQADQDSVVDRIVPGVLDPAYPNTPRYDLYHVGLNSQILPDMRPGAIVTSINTSFGCVYKCDFCCTPVMFKKLTSKPLGAVEREAAILTALRPSFLFIRDENPTLLKDFKDRLRIIATTGAKIYMFASANTLNEETVATLKKNNVYMVCLGLEDPTVKYEKNRKMEEAAGRLKKAGIHTYLSFIVDPLKVVGAEKGAAFYNLLMDRFRALKPEMVCGNFLMPFPGTPMWDRYYHLVAESDFVHYDSKTPFLIKNAAAREKMRYYMFYYQWLYYTSEFYKKNVRRFDTGDTLHLRFLELKSEFDTLMARVKTLRP